MRYLALLLCVSAFGQTAFPTRVDITSNAAKTVGGELRVNNSTNAAYSALTSTSLVFPNLTGLYDNSSGLQVWRSGLIGARATVTPGGALGSGRLTLCNVDISACTGFFADPAMATAAVYQLPGADGSSGDCLSTNGAAVLSWVSCSGGGSTPPFVDTTNIIKGSVTASKLLRFEVDGLTAATTRVWTAQDADITVAGINLAQTWTATQTMRDILPSADDTYKLGDTSTNQRWYQVAANRIDGICTTAFTCTGTNNYLSTRKLNLYDTNGSIGGGFWDVRTNAASPVTSYLEFRDQAGTAFLTLTRQSGSVTVNNATMDGNIIPSTDSFYDQGTSSTRWKTGEFTTLTTRTASGGTRRFQMSGGSILGIDGAGTTQFSVSSLTGQLLSGALAGTVVCLETDASGNINRSAAACGSGTVTSVTGTSPISSSGGSTPAISCSTCVTTSRTVSTTSPLGGGGALSANLTLTCTTCVTTAGGQSIAGTTTLSTLSVTTISGSGNISSSGGYINGTEVRVAGNVVINSSGVLSNSFGVDVNAGVGATGFNIHGGASGHTGSTCSQWTGGICTAP